MSSLAIAEDSDDSIVFSYSNDSDGVSFSEESEPESHVAETLATKETTSTDCSTSGQESSWTESDPWVVAEKVLSVSYCPSRLIAR